MIVKSKKLAFLAGAVFVLSACSETEEGTETVINTTSAVNTRAITAVNVCPAGGVEIEIGIDANGNGVLDSDEVSNTEAVCHGVNGSTGLSGYTSLVLVEDEDAGVNCSDSGIKISSGLDENDSRTLELAEISRSRYICHGRDSQDGENGSNGFNSLVASVEELSGDECAVGGVKISSGLDINRNAFLDLDEVERIEYICDGINGSDGLSSLITTSIEPAGETCAYGGAKFDSGLDDNFNGVLDLDEIDQSEYLCHGSDGETGNQGTNSLVATTDEPSGVNCSEGGLKIVTGLDQNNNQVIEPEEQTNNAYVCNGEDGVAEGVACFLSDGPDGGKVLRCGGDEVFVELPPILAAPEISSITGGYRIVDSWESSGDRDAFDPRNVNYLIDVTESGAVSFDILASGTISGLLFLLDDNGALISHQYGFDSGELELDAGTYTLVAGAYHERSSGNFDIDIIGSVSNIRKVSVNTVELADEWVVSSRSDYESYLNPHFDFTVDRASQFAFEITANVVPRFYLIDSDGIMTDFSTAQEANLQLNPGSYTAVVATNSAETNQNFNLRLTGQISDVSKVSSSKDVLLGTWDASGGRNFTSPANPAYTLTVTEDSQLDVLLEAAQGRYIAILDDIGSPVESGQTSAIGGDAYRLSADLTVGDYTVVVGTYYADASGDYRLTLVGQYSDLNQLR